MLDRSVSGRAEAWRLTARTSFRGRPGWPTDDLISPYPTIPTTCAEMGITSKDYHVGPWLRGHMRRRDTLAKYKMARRERTPPRTRGYARPLRQRYGFFDQIRETGFFPNLRRGNAPHRGWGNTAHVSQTARANPTS